MTSNSILLDLQDGLQEKLKSFERAFPERTVNVYQGEKPSDLTDVRYAVVWHHHRGLLAELPNLEVIFSLGAGVDHIFTDPELPELPIVRFVDANLTGRMVEWVVLQVLLHMRQQRAYDSLQREHEWRELPQAAAHEFTVGFMGFGELGQACAEALRPIGFKLNAWSRGEKDVPGVASYAGNDALGDFLDSTDILVSLLPSTPETRGILNAGLFRQLSRSGPLGAPVVINGGRGASQNENDIIACLEDGTLHGVSLDVFETEPLPVDSQLWDMENAVITPHVAAVSDADALARHVRNQIERHESGLQLEHLVDKTRGY